MKRSILLSAALLSVTWINVSNAQASLDAYTKTKEYVDFVENANSKGNKSDIHGLLIYFEHGLYIGVQSSRCTDSIQLFPHVNEDRDVFFARFRNYAALNQRSKADGNLEALSVTLGDFVRAQYPCGK